MKLSPTLEHQLVRHCLTGCEAAWARLFEYCHPTIVRQTSIWLGPQSKCGELAEEVAGRVWLKLVDSGYRRLALFDPDRGVRITTFLVALARQEFLQFQRERRRRVVREKRGAEKASHRQGHDSEVEILLNEYLGTLTESKSTGVGDPAESHEGRSEPAPEFKLTLDPEKIRQLATILSAHREKCSTRRFADGSKK